MAGHVIERARYSRRDLQANPGVLFVFGDNMEERGLGGQAKEARGEPNAVGIPTKWQPTRRESAYFSDGDLARVKPRIDAAFARLEAHLAGGGDVVWPKDGVGTGLADLPSRSPMIHGYIQERRAALAPG